jgi:hypothetical protein
VIVPAVEFPPATPSTAHVTVLLDSPVTVAVNVCVLPRTRTLAEEGATVTVGLDGGGGVVPFVVVDPTQLICANVTMASRSNGMRRTSTLPVNELVLSGVQIRMADEDRPKQLAEGTTGGQCRTGLRLGSATKGRHKIKTRGNSKSRRASQSQQNQ